ncbi:DNA (cytosine-5-)-methyltransferase [Bacillus sp. FJAT-27264]|uniref:DNA cytosine methyltransferase n=1 Tax=Paenibacillus sp. (strain DSM 101736 / FJAT-27264) TaxID=1850362 RepID=UPI000807C434|nr:DNA cytosine methyltransferase [Bacillus sp. FJAT-27264]OBZ07562.1 DNA (cytosine-5-)-methyltransferase [Bacillus sp. FJAT-27264]
MINDKKYIEKKIARLREQQRPRVLDLFSGCGGLSLGFFNQGFEMVANVEINEVAAKTYARNFHTNEPEERRNLFAKARDITTLEPSDLLKEFYPGEDPKSLIDVIIGGPPCQAYTRVGRAKLREVAQHPEAFKQDPRGNLYLRYLSYVEALQPLAIVMENVPDVLNYGGHNIAEEMCEALEELGYVCKYTILNSVNYGVPQMRERMFLIATIEDLKVEPSFPNPSHWIDIPRGYENARKVALKTIEQLDDNTRFVSPPLPSTALEPALTAEQALGDLPKITNHLKGEMKKGAKRFTEVIPYPADVEVSDYAKVMRNWGHFKSTEGISDHVIRLLPRDYPIFKRMQPGDQYPQAYNVALEILNEKIMRLKKDGENIMEDTPEYDELKAKIVPPYDASKFPNKWRKMEGDLPARTLMAHLEKDGYSHIHYDSNQARTISVREAARLQSFPDAFKFEGTMNPAFRQIGNAVPPMMASAIAINLKKILDFHLRGANNFEY